jgi:FSR family fosmidomycin resistance protein-like MFS transporter
MNKKTLYSILVAISVVHLLNDTIQAVIPAIFPILEKSLNLNYFQIGLIAFALQMTASVMQPLVGLYTDKKPSPYLLPMGMVSTFIGMLVLAYANHFAWALVAVIFVGLGSAVFHPEGARVAYMAAGPKRGLAQSIFQVGGNGGQALAPLLTLLVFAPLGQFGAIWFTLVAAAAILVQLYIASWYKAEVRAAQAKAKQVRINSFPPERKKQISNAMLILLVFVFARTWYHSGIAVYYPFYLIKEAGIAYEQALVYIFLFLAAGALGTFAGGPLADRFGRKNIMLFSMLGSAPLALILPYTQGIIAYILISFIGFIILSSFSVMVVYGQELIPGQVGMVSGLIIGLAFGLGGIGAAALGGLADWLGLPFIMIFTSVLPLVGIIAWLLPSDRQLADWSKDEIE